MRWRRNHIPFYDESPLSFKSTHLYPARDVETEAHWGMRLTAGNSASVVARASGRNGQCTSQAVETQYNLILSYPTVRLCQIHFCLLHATQTSFVCGVGKAEWAKTQPKNILRLPRFRILRLLVAFSICDWVDVASSHQSIAAAQYVACCF